MVEVKIVVYDIWFASIATQFCDFNLRDRQNGAGIVKHLHSSTKHEIWVKIRLVVPEIDCSEVEHSFVRFIRDGG